LNVQTIPFHITFNTPNKNYFILVQLSIITLTKKYIIADKAKNANTINPIGSIVAHILVANNALITVCTVYAIVNIEITVIIVVNTPTNIQNTTVFYKMNIDILLNIDKKLFIGVNIESQLTLYNPLNKVTKVGRNASNNAC